MVLQDLYETEYGIYNHLTNTKRPLASVALHSCEDPNDGSLLEETIRTYASRGIKDLFGLSLIEFLELPIDIIEILTTVANDEQSKKASVLTDIEQQYKLTK